MSGENVVEFPRVENALARRQAQNLRELFLSRKRNQRSTFEHLSRHVEELVARVKENGERTGAIKRAFGEELVHMKSRFTAKNGVPPQQLYQTPEAWLRVLEGLAKVLGLDPLREIARAFEYSPLVGQTARSGFSRVTWLQELETVVESMSQHLASAADFSGLAQYVADAGLYAEGDKLFIREWPSEIDGLIENEPYSPWILGLIPHLFGLNFELIGCDHDALNGGELFDLLMRLDLHFLDNGVSTCQISDEIAGQTVSAKIIEGSRTGIAIAVKAGETEASVGLIEWQIRELQLLDMDDKLIHSTAIPREVHLPFRRPTENDMPIGHSIMAYPPNWLANSLRIHFLGSPGFARLASGKVVRPWIWEDRLDCELYYTDASEDMENFPLVCPPHTAAGVIESNLLYADQQACAEKRIDRHLLSEIRRIVAMVEDFRSSRSGLREVAKSILLAEWNSNLPQSNPVTSPKS